jgi:hypothetical protein
MQKSITTLVAIVAAVEVNAPAETQVEIAWMFRSIRVQP